MAWSSTTISLLGNIFLVQLARKMFPRRLIVVEDQAIQPAKQAPVCVIEHVLGDYTTSHFEVVSYGNSNYQNAVYTIYTDCGKNKNGKLTID